MSSVCHELIKGAEMQHWVNHSQGAQGLVRETEDRKYITYQAWVSDIKDKSLVSRCGRGQVESVVKEGFSNKVICES